MLAEWDRRIQGYSRRVVGRGRLGMDLDDVAQDLRWTFIESIRRYGKKHDGRLPEPQLMTVVLQRRVGRLNRGSRVWFRLQDEAIRRSISDEDHDFDTMADDSIVQVDVDMIRAETEAALAGVIYALRANVTPMTFSILHLRLIEELTPTEIAEIVDVDSSLALSKRIGYAKRIASDFLTSHGIHTLGDIECAASPYHR